MMRSYVMGSVLTLVITKCIINGNDYLLIVSLLVWFAGCFIFAWIDEKEEEKSVKAPPDPSGPPQSPH